MAFEDFKNERGSEINRIFKENKSILNERRKRASETTQRINAIKREMDMTKEALNLQKSLREKQGKRAEKVAGGQWDLSSCLGWVALGTGGPSWKGSHRGCRGTALIPGASLGSGQPWGAGVLLCPSAHTFFEYVLNHSVVSDSLQLHGLCVVHQAPLSMGILQVRILEWVATPSSRSLNMQPLIFTYFKSYAYYADISLTPQYA